jgi:putative transposase
MTLFRNKYRVESTRLRGFDYAKNGAYFITIITKNRICLFGEITHCGAVETGLRPVSITDPTVTHESTDPTETISFDILIPKMIISDAGKIVSDCWYDLPKHYNNIILDEFILMPNHIHGIIKIQNRNDGNIKHGLSEFMRAFKSFSSRRINEINGRVKNEIWQSRFYDHVIRSEDELSRIQIYIRNNVFNWRNDNNFH